MEVEAGDIVTVHGAARERTATGTNVRVTLERVRVEHPARPSTCSLPRLVTYVETVDMSLAAGHPVAVRGTWVRLGRRGAWPRRPGRGVIVSGRMLDLTGARAGPAPRLKLMSVLDAGRARASDRLRRLLPPDVEAVGRALVLAERDDVPGSVRTRFVDAGLAHLLAISGLHVAIVAGLLTLILAPVVSRLRAIPVAAGLVLVYVLAIGSPPSAMRASFLVCGWAIARMRGRPPRTWDLLGLAAIVALLADPLSLTEPGLQLSFAGFTGLGIGVTVWQTASAAPALRALSLRARRAGVADGVMRRLGATAAAGLAGLGAFAVTGPIAAAHFQRVAPVAVVSHFVGAPLTVAAIAALAMAILLPLPLAGLTADAAGSVLRLLVHAADRLAEVPGGHAYVAPPGPLEWTALVLAAIATVRFLHTGRLAAVVLPLSAAGALLIAGTTVYAQIGGSQRMLCTLDVGQGDGAALRTGGGRWIVFDAGPAFGRLDAGRDRILPLIRRHGGRHVSLFVLSHPDLDHLGGFDAIQSAVPVRRVLDTGDPLPKAGYRRFLARVREEGIHWMKAGSGDRLTIDDVTITVLGPRHSRGRRGGNETSLQVRVTIGDRFVYLNTGDATAAEELQLLGDWPSDSLRADLLKVGHHGSRTSTDPRWLNTVKPTLAVISAGRGNAYGHPHPSVLGRLRSADVPEVWRTDRHGTLCVEVARSGRWRISGERSWRTPLAEARILTSQKGEE